MAKIRVFELARDLNMTNKVLLERMRDLDISVVSHLSSLEDEDVAKIKENVVGGKHKKAQVIPAKPTIIRRRRDTVAKEAVPDEKPPLPPIPPEKSEAFPEIAEPGVKESEHPLSAEMRLKQEKPEPPDIRKTPDFAEAEELDVSESENPVSVKPVSTEEPALIISPAVNKPKTTKAPSDIVEIAVEEDKTELPETEETEELVYDALSVPEKSSVESSGYPEMPLGEPTALTLDARMGRKKEKETQKGYAGQNHQAACPCS